MFTYVIGTKLPMSTHTLEHGRMRYTHQSWRCLARSAPAGFAVALASAHRQTLPPSGPPSMPCALRGEGAPQNVQNTLRRRGQVKLTELKGSGVFTNLIFGFPESENQLHKFLGARGYFRVILSNRNVYRLGPGLLFRPETGSIR